MLRLRMWGLRASHRLYEWQRQSSELERIRHESAAKKCAISMVAASDSMNVIERDLSICEHLLEQRKALMITERLKYDNLMPRLARGPDDRDE